RDFTLNSVQEALAELFACVPVYRSYVAPEDVTLNEVDRAHVEAAVRAAKRRNPAVSESLFDFLRQLLLCEDPEGLDERQRAERRDFVLRLQQLTSPVTAKGIEDTAFYRYFPLASLNEVGGEPDRFGTSVEEFHRFNLERQRLWPHGLSATTTHDTKRSEDTRARIAVLSEIPEAWAQAVARWRTLNQRHKTDVGGTELPDANEEYLLYQTLVGTWPLAPPDLAGHERYVGRIQEYMNKALKEAKVHTSWVNPNEAHDRAIERFVQAALDPVGGQPFAAEVTALVRRIAPAGLCNALSQVVLKIASPGVPDFYQGTELWDFSLVDPDNRRPVDYELRRRLLGELRAVAEAELPALAERLLRHPEDGRVKLLVTLRGLGLRRARRELFERGEYRPLEAQGGHAEQVVAFGRRLGEEEVVALAARGFVGLGMPERLPLGPAVWRDTAVALGEGGRRARYRDVLTGRVVVTRDSGALVMGEVFAHLPVALLERG
ncbi:MAG TPA: malto-oligosyltrehalose synthase, partial [Polyangia bacterium]|nr:malto-oligosyltrehalose synthase [Polyangia bacterium]